ncbi:hypothetical protein EDD15DRAFT_2262202 [Pisolithus albus]|nr:hypothetical protein EDD15DRAFT_2262202 [Pisolithus albus]
MFMEDDRKNCASLEAAGLPDFVDCFVHKCLYDGHRNGWPADNAVNSLTLWLVWLTTTEGMCTTLEVTAFPDRCREGVLPTMVIVIFPCFYLQFSVYCIFTLPFYLVFVQVLAYVSQTRT